MIMDAVEETKKSRGPKKYWITKNGKLYARLQYINEQGEYRDKYKPLTDKRDARGAVEEMRRELKDHGEELLHSDKVTFAEVADKYEEVELIEAIYQNGVKIQGRRSIASVKSAIKPLRAYFGKKAIRSINSSDLKVYKTKRLNTPVEKEVNVKTTVIDEKTGKKKTLVTKSVVATERKVATVNRELAWLRAILNFAINNDWLVKNPFAKTKGIISTAEVERDRILSFAEEEKLLSFCTGDGAHLKPILICALDTALRRGEMLKIRWQDVNFETGEIYVSREISKVDFDRTVGITARLKAELEKLRAVSPKNPNLLVFGIKTGVKTAFGTAREKAELEGFRLHDCRYTATTRMIASGSPHVEVMKITGHKQSETARPVLSNRRRVEVMKITGHKQLKTFLRYLNITPETAQKCASRLDEYLTQSKSNKLVD